MNPLVFRLDLVDDPLDVWRVGDVGRDALGGSPPCWIAWSVPCNPSTERATPTTVAPQEASFTAMARPIPRDAPVTSAT